jgi:signal transduction histidine kinase/CheY-like chemotaxis protein
MNNKIGILHLEDSFKDSEIINAIIESAKIEYNYFLADCEKDFLNFLETENIHLILSGYSLPDYDGNEVLRVAREKYPHIPFIFVSGEMGEGVAIEKMLNGATDYVFKNNLERLVPAIKRALNHHELEIQRKQVEISLQEKKEIIIAQSGKYFEINKELDFQNEEKEKRAAELIIANKELAFQNREKEKRADELFIANKELIYQNQEKEKRAAELIIANKELLYQNEEKEKRAAELRIANKELAFQNREKEKRADELIIANKELAYQNEEKEKRAAELIIANKELLYQNEEKEKRAAELIIAKDKAEESDRLKSAFLANMSHEIRTPMNGILGFAELLKEPELTGELQQEYIGIIQKSGARMMNIISDIMSISKIESGQMGISISEMNINEQMEELITFFKPEAEQKGLEIFLKNNLDSEETIVKTDRDKVHAILANLIKNALKFTDKGSIEFGYGSTGSPSGSVSEPVELEFYVKDTGIGIDPEKIEMIFERFRQGNETLNKKYEGAGLGLSISKAFVEMLGGKIWIKRDPVQMNFGNSRDGIGTTVCFTIPYNT